MGRLPMAACCSGEVSSAALPRPDVGGGRGVGAKGDPCTKIEPRMYPVPASRIVAVSAGDASGGGGDMSGVGSNWVNSEKCPVPASGDAAGSAGTCAGAGGATSCGDECTTFTKSVSATPSADPCVDATGVVSCGVSCEPVTITEFVSATAASAAAAAAAVDAAAAANAADGTADAA